MTTRQLFTTIPLLLLAAGCANVAQKGAAPVAPLAHDREVELAAFQDAQRVFRAQNIGTHKFDFEGHGRVTVREILLEGFPGGAYLKCRFHYQNRTKKPVVQSWVSLDVLDAEGYRMSVFSSASMNYPELRDTAWAGIPGAVHDDFPAQEAWRRDELAAEALVDWVGPRGADEPFFAFFSFSSLISRWRSFWRSFFAARRAASASCSAPLARPPPRRHPPRPQQHRREPIASVHARTVVSHAVSRAACGCASVASM